MLVTGCAGAVAGAVTTAALILLWVLGAMFILVLVFFLVRGWPSKIDWKPRFPAFMDGFVFGVGAAALGIGLGTSEEGAATPWIAAVGAALLLVSIAGGFFLVAPRQRYFAKPS